MSGIKIGARVTVPTKNVGEGTIAFIGETDFAKGTKRFYIFWIMENIQLRID